MNFSNSDIWNESLFIRYPINKIVKVGQLYFYNNNGILICQNFFNLNISHIEIEGLIKKINEGNKIKFSYINDSQGLDVIKQIAIDNKFTYEIIDSWEAPRLSLKTELSNYFMNECGNQIKRNYKIYKNNKENYKFYNSNNNDVLKLWDYVLKIDFDSWKKEENSDMKSLNREDLQYLPFLLLKRDKSNLIVICDNDDNPLAYSLMFKDENYCWYAVKWGASYIGRKKYAGFMALFNHLEYIASLENQINIDFWGRRNKTYDSLKNNFINRKHIIIYKKED